MNTGKALLGLLAGFAAGATLGILFAPDKGSSIRRKISQKSDEYADEIGERFNEFVGVVTKKLENIKKEASRIVENGKVNVEEGEAELITARNRNVR